MKKKLLFKSSTNKMLDGVCAGLGEYFDIDPTLVRIVFAGLTILSGVVPGVLVYVALAIIMPRGNVVK